jgi:hypothetical protein
MPTRSTSTPSTSVSALATTLQSQLTASTATTIYVPLDDGDVPTEDELHALLGEGLHAEVDVVRNALAVRAATEDEIDDAKAAEAEAKAPTTTTPATVTAA